MAKSNARKRRDKMVREGKLDPTLLRSTHSGLYERKTKTMKEKWLQHMQKYRNDLHIHNDDEGFFYLFAKASNRSFFYSKNFPSFIY
ncbi:hypothetical protein J2S11_001741 [Bacillus horti]|uniref:Uncharacterized protein n=1 Tax=Caldalkalibacillus horti TaxID=77523 RepID=A0ABT9VZ08_9BACI|nr:hypothetical protein [Bacillus horti]